VIRRCIERLGEADHIKHELEGVIDQAGLSGSFDADLRENARLVVKTLTDPAKAGCSRL
jgi:hypothetical protein